MTDAGPVERKEGVIKHEPQTTNAKSSKYDFVKVRVWLGSNYHVLSRFLITRLLTVTKIPNSDAVRIALKLKKVLVDQSQFDISQADLEQILFKVMKSYGYTEPFLARYKMMSKFHSEREPLVVLLGGTGLIGKSVLAMQLAARLNLSTVLQTKLVWSFCCAVDASLSPLPLYLRKFASERQLLDEFAAQCRLVRQYMNHDLTRAQREGRSLLIVGIHVDPVLFADVLAPPTASSSAAATATASAAVESKSSPAAADSVAAVKDTTAAGAAGSSFSLPKPAALLRADSAESVAGAPLRRMLIAGGKGSMPADSSESESEGASRLDLTASAAIAAERLSSKPAQSKESKSAAASAPPASSPAVVAPFLLELDEFDHALLAHNFLAKFEKLPSASEVAHAAQVRANLAALARHLRARRAELAKLLRDRETATSAAGSAAAAGAGSASGAGAGASDSSAGSLAVAATSSDAASEATLQAGAEVRSSAAGDDAKSASAEPSAVAATSATTAQRGDSGGSGNDSGAGSGSALMPTVAVQVRRARRTVDEMHATVLDMVQRRYS